MNPVLSEVLNFIKPAATQLVSTAAAAAGTELPKLSAEGLSLLENVVAPKLDVPATIIALAKGENGAIESAVDTFAEAELELLVARVDALL